MTRLGRWPYSARCSPWAAASPTPARATAALEQRRAASPPRVRPRGSGSGPSAVQHETPSAGPGTTKLSLTRGQS
eukprot:scaffold5760_cov57-Phaeocystis_antarctica.AAC.2